MSDVLITGATGLLGSVLTRRLVEGGQDVRILRRGSSNLDLLAGVERRIEHCIGDIADPIALADAMAGVERVYHAAAFIGVGGRRERRTLTRVNVDGTSAVVNSALRTGIRRLVHVSSMAAFGRTLRPEGVIDESSEWQRSKANSEYAYSKYLAEIEVRRGIAEGLDAVVVNPALMFGVGRPGENTRVIVDRVRTRRLPAIPSGGTNVVDVEDVADGLILAMRLGESGERYFLGAENLSWEKIIIELAQAFGTRPPRFRLSHRPAIALAMLSEGVAMLTRSNPMVTRESARTASRVYRYSSRKAQDYLGWNGRPFRETANRIASELVPR